jgi:hypothetical protein
LSIPRCSNGRPSYVCRNPQQHLRRSAPHADAYVGLVVAEYLNRDDNRDVLRPAVRPGIDAPALRMEAAQFAERKKAQMRMHASGAIDDADLAEGLKEIKRRLGTITATLAATTEPDPLAEFRDQPDAQRCGQGCRWPASARS